MVDKPVLAKHAAALTAIAAGGLDPDVVAAAEAEILIGQATGVMDNKAVSGDITINAAGTVAIGAAKIATAMIKDDAVDATKLSSSDDFTVGTLEATTVTGTSGVATKYAHHTGIALADLTAAFGNPAALPNNTVFLYKDDTSSKTYVVTIIASVFQIAETTPVTA